MNFLFFDTETTGLPNRSQPLAHASQPRMMELGFILEIDGRDALVVDTLIHPGKTLFDPHPKAFEAHGITNDDCLARGIPLGDALNLWLTAVENADFLVGHNTDYDTKIMTIEYSRMAPLDIPANVLGGLESLCTMKKTTPICKIPKKDGRVGWKWPKLQEAYKYYFGKEFENAHSAYADISATRDIFRLIYEDGEFKEEIAAWEKRTYG